MRVIQNFLKIKNLYKELAQTTKEIEKRKLHQKALNLKKKYNPNPKLSETHLQESEDQGETIRSRTKKKKH
jgi:cell fate (sporulation/competence/biofilm development) regulator YlbF (YheA/YmcA/DUF963 family)